MVKLVQPMEYSAYYKDKLKQGEAYQEFVGDIFLNHLNWQLSFYKTKYSQYNFGETHEGVEVKFDDRLKETGNLYIEYAEKSHPDNKAYVPSGVCRNDNTWLFVIGDRDVVFLFSKRVLKSLTSSKAFKHVTTPTSKGYLIKREDAQTLCLKEILLEKKPSLG